MKEKQDSRRKYPIQFMTTFYERDKIDINAESANLNRSAYLRNVALSDDKVIFLDKGGFIARNLIEINDKLTQSLRDGKISQEIGESILSQTKLITEKLLVIANYLTEIDNDEEE